jgi:hypothetical protein
LVVFELKKGTLTRDAVAQIIDYASYLAGLESDDLCHLISENSGRLGIEKIDFRERYETEYPDQPVTEIGVPRIVLVGLGVDERAKRMVQFLAKSELDISLITFYGFKLDGKTLLARQVEVQAATPQGERRSTKAGNQAILDRWLTELGILQNYEVLIAATTKGLGDSAYQWPNSTGYSFSLRATSASGGHSYRAYLGLFAPDRNGKVQVVLQARAIEAAGAKRVEELAQAMGSKFEKKPTFGEIWIDGHKPATNYAESLTALAQAIVVGWKATMEAPNQTTHEEEVSENVHA